MGISQLVLGRLFLYATLLGGVLGGVYDLLRLTRMFLGIHYSRRTSRRLRQIRLPLLPVKKERGENRALGIVLFLEDLLFGLGSGIALILLFYELDNGKLRFPAILCCGAGFLIYRFTLGRPIMLAFEFVAYFLETAVRYAVFFVSCPFVWAARRIKRCIGRLCRGARERYERSRRVRYTACQQKRITSDGCGMLSQIGDPEKNGIKKGKRYVREKKETVQSEPTHSRLSGSDRGRIHRGVRKQPDEV